MPNLEAARKRYETAEDLLSVVRMMKALAAANIREYEQAQESLSGYSWGILLAFRGLLQAYPLGRAPLREPSRVRTGIIVFGSDQGMCGQFNDRIAEHTVRTMARLEIGGEDSLVVSIGQRVYDRLIGIGLPVEENLMVPSSPAGIPFAVRDLIGIIDRWSTESKISRVILEYNHHLSGAAYEPVTVRLLPLDQEWLRELRGRPWPTRELPVFRMDADTLFSHLVKHYLISNLFQAFAESLASENASRLAAMQGAEKNIRDRIVELKGQYHQVRQVAITEELLDIISGFNVLKGRNR